jgi:hypothetical protein
LLYTQQMTLEVSLSLLVSHLTRIELLSFVGIQAQHAGAETYPKVAASPGIAGHVGSSRRAKWPKSS